MKKQYTTPKISYECKGEEFNLGIVAIVAVVVWHLVG